MPQADQSATAAEPAGGAEATSWWRTLPGMLTATAGLVSAITGLVVAVQQLRPAHSGTPTATVAAQPPASAPSETPTVAAGAAAMRVSFPAGTTVTANHGLRFDVLSADTSVDNPGRLALAVHVKMTNPGQYDANFWNRSFRLRVGSDTSAPTNFLNDIVPGGTTKVGEVDFVLDAGTRQATLLVGDDPSTAVALPLSLRPPP